MIEYALTIQIILSMCKDLLPADRRSDCILTKMECIDEFFIKLNGDKYTNTYVTLRYQAEEIRKCLKK